MALAQHHGVPTRLLDWSESPYVSLFFAVWGNDDEDAGLYVIPRPTESSDLGGDPFEVNTLSVFYPGYVTARLVSQRGLFTIHPNPKEFYNPDDAKQLVIKSEVKRDFRRKLDAMGLHHFSIYADLDGLSRRLVNLQGYRSRSATNFAKVIAPAANKVPLRTKIDLRDPQKGQWGGEPSKNGFELIATVSEAGSGWYKIVLTVRPVSTSGKKMGKEVTFHLHDSFKRPVVKKPVLDGEANSKHFAYGAFTVGAELDDGTKLELDLSKVKSAPREFRLR